MDDIGTARKAIAKVVRAEIRLKYSLMADAEIERVLPERLTEFDVAIQQGHIPAYSLKLVAGDDSAH